MSIVRHDDRPVLGRGPGLPTLQRLIDRASGADAVAVLINVFSRGQAVPEPLGELRVRACVAQAERLLAWAAAWPQRTWAVEGAGGIGQLLAHAAGGGAEGMSDPAVLSARRHLT